MPPAPPLPSLHEVHLGSRGYPVVDVFVVGGFTSQNDLPIGTIQMDGALNASILTPVDLPTK